MCLFHSFWWRCGSASWHCLRSRSHVPYRCSRRSNLLCDVMSAWWRQLRWRPKYLLRCFPRRVSLRDRLVPRSHHGGRVPVQWCAGPCLPSGRLRHSREPAGRSSSSLVPGHQDRQASEDHRGEVCIDVCISYHHKFVRFASDMDRML